MNIGILGGTFNPVHNGHLHIAQSALTDYHLDHVDFMPAYIPPHKQSELILDDKTRTEMIELAIKGYSHFTLNPYELNVKGISYTYRTLINLEASYPDNHYFFIIGDDSLRHFLEWMKPAVILEHCTLLVAKREQSTDAELMPYVHKLQQLTPTCDLRFLSSPVMDISSSTIRSNVGKGLDISSYVPSAVSIYIHQHKLYQQGVINEK